MSEEGLREKITDIFLGHLEEVEINQLLSLFKETIKKTKPNISGVSNTYDMGYADATMEYEQALLKEIVD